MTTEREEYFKAYEEYSKGPAHGVCGLRHRWSGPATHERDTRKSHQGIRSGKSLAALFLAGVALQVVLAALNKFSMWGSTSANSRRPSNPRVATGFVTGSAISSGLISRSMSRR